MTSGGFVGDFLRERMFEPLGMTDTAFNVSPEQRDRFTTAYAPDPESGTRNVLDSPETSRWNEPPAFPDASGWLVSTLDDYWSFVQMLLSKGVRNGERILSDDVVTRMTTNHLTPGQREANRLFLEGHDWGFGMRTPAAGAIATTSSVGFGWDGGTGTAWRSDVERDLTCILFTQRAMTSPEPPEIFIDFFDGAHRALAD